jgi:FkbM family methyltransferase
MFLKTRSAHGSGGGGAAAELRRWGAAAAAPPSTAGGQPPPRGGMWRAPLAALAGSVAVVILVTSVQLLDDGRPGRASGRVVGYRAMTDDALAAAGDGDDVRDSQPFCPDDEQPAGHSAVFHVFDPAALPPGRNLTAECPHWATLSYPPPNSSVWFSPRVTLPICTHDPAVDVHVSGEIAANGYLMSPRILAALQAANPCGDHVGSGGRRPYAIDAGANIGSWSLLLAALGCHVLAFEPLQANLDRLAASAAAAGLADRVTLFRNALGRSPSSSTIEAALGNSGGNSVGDASSLGASPGDAGPVLMPVEVVTLDALVAALNGGDAAAAGRPVAVVNAPQVPVGADGSAGAAPAPVPLASWLAGHLPFGLPRLSPATIGAAKVDTEGHDALVLAGGRVALASAPLLLLEFEPAVILGVARCDPHLLARHLWGGPSAGGGGGDALAADYNTVFDGWRMVPLPPPCAPSTARMLRDMRAYAAAGGDAGTPSGWPEGWDEWLMVRKGAPFLDAVLRLAARVRGNDDESVYGPLRECA